MQNIDYEFIVKMLYKYRKHLIDVEKTLLKYIDNQVNYVEGLAKTDEYRYRDVIRNYREKISEAQIKLSHVQPNIMNITKQMHLLVTEHGLEDTTWLPPVQE